ncbi:MAG: hypothetical protein C0518_12995 [Opitutus sp.]|nr:hypothetical protein [Opitutus sp.]
MPTADKFAEAVRAGAGTFALTKVRIDCGRRQILRGAGSLVLKPERFEITVTLPNSAPVPAEPKGLIKAADCWKLDALVEGRLGIKSARLFPAPRRRIMSRVQTLTFKLEALDLEVDDHQRQTTNQMRKEHGLPPLKGPKRRVEFFAVIPKTELVFLNAGTETTVKHPYLGPVGTGGSTDTYMAETKDFEFALIERNGDLHVHARSRAGYRGTNRAHDERLMQGLLAAVGFVHGVHPWPSHQRAWLNGRLWLHRLRAPEPRAHSRYAPFPRSFGFGKAEQDPKLGVGRSLSLAAEYFGMGEPLAEALASSLHFFREATDSGTHFRLGTHALCSILEGLVRSIAEQITATDPQAKAAADSFTAAQVQAAKLLKDHLADSVERRRLIGLIESAQMLNIQDEFKRVCIHLGLPWEELFATHFAAWKSERNLTHHGKLSKLRDTDFHHQALIASAIVLLALRVVGYHGPAFKRIWGIEGTACKI